METPKQIDQTQHIVNQLILNKKIDNKILIYAHRKIHIDLFYKYVDVIRQLLKKDVELLISNAAKESESLDFYYSMSSGPSINELTNDIRQKLSSLNEVEQIRYFCDLFISRFQNICQITKDLKTHLLTIDFLTKVKHDIDNELNEYDSFEKAQYNNR